MTKIRYFNLVKQKSRKLVALVAMVFHYDIVENPLMKMMMKLKMKPKKKDKENNETPLPMVQPEHFQLDKGGMYWFDHEGVKHKIAKAGVCANGVRDLCIYWKGPGTNDVSVGKIVDVAKEHILLIPKGDILWIKFEPPLANGGCCFFFDIKDSVGIEDVVREILCRFGGEKGSDYDMFGGEQYL